MATHSSILAEIIPWTESTGSQKEWDRTALAGSRQNSRRPNRNSSGIMKQTEAVKQSFPPEMPPEQNLLPALLCLTVAASPRSAEDISPSPVILRA